MMTKKYYYSLFEASELLSMSIDDLMHLGITGQIELSFDWALLRTEIIINDLPFILTFQWSNAPSEQWQRTVDLLLDSEHLDDPHSRLFPLSTGLLSVINKYGYAKLTKSYDSFTQLELIIKNKNQSTNIDGPLLRKEDIIIHSASFDTLKKKAELSQDNISNDFSVKAAFEDDAAPDLLYFAYSLNKEVWPIPPHMNLPTKSQLYQILKTKGVTSQADMDAIIRLSTPNEIKLGGKPKISKIDFVTIAER